MATGQSRTRGVGAKRRSIAEIISWPPNKSYARDAIAVDWVILDLSCRPRQRSTTLTGAERPLSGSRRADTTSALLPIGTVLVLGVPSRQFFELPFVRHEGRPDKSPLRPNLKPLGRIGDRLLRPKAPADLI